MYRTEHAKAVVLGLLESEGVPYLLLSEFTGGVGGDLDLYIPLSAAEQFEAFCRAKGVLQQSRPTKYPHHFFYFVQVPGLRPVRLHVKFELAFWDQQESAYRIAAFQAEALDKAVRAESGVIPEAWHLILLYAAKCAFVERMSLERRQLEQLCRYIEQFLPSLASFPDRVRTARDITDAITACEFDRVSSPRRIRHVIDKHFPFQKPKIEKKVRPTIARRWGPPAYCVLFVGCDGAGKSTLVDAVQKALELPAIRLYAGLGANEWMLPGVYRFWKFAEGLRLPMRYAALALCLGWLFPLEFLIRRLRRTLLARNCVVLVDRYPEYAFLGVKGKYLSRLYSWVLPLPDVVVEVSAPIEVLVQRRPGELTADSARERVNQSNSLARVFEKRGAKWIQLETVARGPEDAATWLVQEMWRSDKFRDGMLCNASAPR